MESRKKVINSIKNAGLIVPPRPEYSEDLFNEWEEMKKKYGGIGNIPFQVLGEYLDKWNSLIAYALWVEAAADIERATAREIRDTIKNQLYTLQDGGRELRAASVTIEPLYVKWENNYVEKEAVYTAVRSLREGYEQRAAAISREITRRINEINDVKRGDR